ncbi:MAG: electron transport complex subunit RsxC [Candidatus Omnitrophota bacterium]
MFKLEEYTCRTQYKPIQQAPIPPLVYIPLSQHTGKICAPLVKIGDYVNAGQMIADAQAQVYAPIHASISGKITAIQDYPHPVLGQCPAIVIENKNQDNPLPSPSIRQADTADSQSQEIVNLTPEQIRDMIFKAGIAGMGGAGFPAHIKLNPPKPVDTLIINGAECEPYLAGDNRLMIEKTKQIIQGIKLIVRCLKVKEVCIAIEENKPEAIKAVKEELTTLHITHYTLHILKSNYPQGGEKQLIKAVLRREVPRGKLPFDAGVIVQNIGTIFAIYEAVYKHKPLYERIVTVTGNCLSNPQNLLVRVGTPIKELIAFCGPLTEEPAKIIIGGPMMGIAQYTDEVPVIKTTSGVILMSAEESRIQEEISCIRCGACIENCPMGLMPCLINLASEKKKWPETKIYGALDCIECGSCDYVCPANRKLVQSIKTAKWKLR